MTEKPRGTCPVCGRSIQLRADGKIRQHGAQQKAMNCAGAGKAPKG